MCFPIYHYVADAESPEAYDYIIWSTLGLCCRKDAQNANISSRLEEEQNSVAQLQKKLKELQVQRRRTLFFCSSLL